MRIPFDCVDLVCVSLEGFDRLVLPQLTDVDLLVCGAGGETLLRFPEEENFPMKIFTILGLSPVNVQGRGGVE